MSDQTPSPRRPILIDTDTASDDAVALIMALRSPAVDVRAITVVAGNCSVEQATSNALYTTAELCGSNAPPNDQRESISRVETPFRQIDM